MHGNTIDFGFPSLSEDPFSSSPLEKDESDLLVGRHALFDELERKITFKSANRILLVGEFGSKNIVHAMFEFKNEPSFED